MRFSIFPSSSASGGSPDLQVMLSTDPEDRELEWEIGTNSTASNLDGPGRNFDNLLGFFGRKIERRFNGAERPPPGFYPSLPPAPRLSQASFATDSDITDGDNSGAGRLADKALRWGGEHLERFVTAVSLRTGRGPLGLLQAIMQHLYADTVASCVPIGCQREGCQDVFTPSPTPPPPPAKQLHEVFAWLTYIMNYRPKCPRCEYANSYTWLQLPDRKVRKMTKLLRSSNIYSQKLALQFITIISITSPEVRNALLGLRTRDKLDKLFTTLWERVDVDPLLASSRQALVILSDVEVISVVSNFEILVRQMLIVEWRNILRQLVSWFQDPDKQLMAVALTDGLFLRLNFNLFSWIDSDDETLFTQLWIWIATTSDPVAIAVLTEFLLRGYSVNDGDWGKKGWIRGLVVFLKCHPECVQALPTVLQVHIQEFPLHIRQKAEDAEAVYKWGRAIDWWKRALWWYDPEDPQGEPDDDWKFYMVAAGNIDKPVSIDVVWTKETEWRGRRSRATGKGRREGTRAKSTTTDWRTCLWTPLHGWSRATDGIPGWPRLAMDFHSYILQEFDDELAGVRRGRSKSV